MEDNTTKGVIQLYDGWVILVDENQWILAKQTQRIRKETGKPRYDNYGYYTKLASALKACCERNIHLKLSNGYADQCGAVATIREEHERMQKFIAENIPDV